MSVRATQWAWEQGIRHQLKSGDLLVLVRIADHADNDGVCWPGNKDLAEHCVCDESTIRRRIQRLAKCGLLHRERRVLRQGRGRKHDAICLAMKAGDQTGNLPGCSSATKQAPLHGPNRHGGADQTGTAARGSNKGTHKEPSENRETVLARLFDFWRSETGRGDGTKFTPNRRKALNARLEEGYTPELIETAIKHAAASPFHQGKNDRNTRYDDLTHICRNGEKLEWFAEMNPGASGDDDWNGFLR